MDAMDSSGVDHTVAIIDHSLRGAIEAQNPNRDSKIRRHVEIVRFTVDSTETTPETVDRHPQVYLEAAMSFINSL
jgi:hypothetical protein